MKGQTFQNFQIQSMRNLSVEGFDDVANCIQAALWSQVVPKEYLTLNLIFQNSTHQEWSSITDLKELDASLSEPVFFLAS